MCLLIVDVPASGAELGRVLHLLRGEVYCGRGMLSPGAHLLLGANCGIDKTQARFFHTRSSPRLQSWRVHKLWCGRPEGWCNETTR